MGVSDGRWTGLMDGMICDECDGVVVRRESAEELSGGVLDPAARPEYGQIF